MARTKSLLVWMSLASSCLAGCTESSPARIDARAGDGPATVDGPLPPEGPTIRDAASGREPGDRSSFPRDSVRPDASRADARIVDTNLYDIWGTSATSIWFMGDLGTAIYYDGAKYSIVPSGTSSSINRIWGSGPTDIWAVGRYFVLHYDGTKWSKAFTPLDELGLPAELWAIHGSSSGDVWAGGFLCAFYHYDGSAWSYRAAGPPSSGSQAYSIWVDSPNTAWAILYQNQVWHREGSSWKLNYQAPPAVVSLQSLWGISSTDIWATAEQDGTLHHYDGAKWTSTASGSLSPLYDVWGGTSDDVWVVGGNGTILHFDGTTWSPSPSGTQATLTAVWGTSRTDVWAAGSGGTILRYDGKTWTRVVVAAP